MSEPKKSVEEELARALAEKEKREAKKGKDTESKSKPIQRRSLGTAAISRTAKPQAKKNPNPAVTGSSGSSFDSTTASSALPETSSKRRAAKAAESDDQSASAHPPTRVSAPLVRSTTPPSTTNAPIVRRKPGASAQNKPAAAGAPPTNPKFVSLFTKAAAPAHTTTTSDSSAPLLGPPSSPPPAPPSSTPAVPPSSPPANTLDAEDETPPLDQEPIESSSDDDSVKPVRRVKRELFLTDSKTIKPDITPVEALNILIAECESEMSEYLRIRRSSARTWISKTFSSKAEERNVTAKGEMVDEAQALIAQIPSNELGLEERRNSIIDILFKLSLIAENAQKNVAFSFVTTSNTKIAIDKIKEKMWDYLAKYDKDLHLELINSVQRMLLEAKKPANKTADAEDNRFKNRSAELEYAAEQIYPAGKVRAALYKHQADTYKTSASAITDSDNFFATLINDCSNRMSTYLTKDRTGSLRTKISGLFSDSTDITNARAKENVVNQVNQLIQQWSGEMNEERIAVNEGQEVEINMALERTIILLLQLTQLAEQAQQNVALSFLMTSNTKIAIDDVKDKILNFLAKNDPELHFALIQTHQRMMRDAKDPEIKDQRPNESYAIDETGKNKFKNKGAQLEFEAEQIFPAKKVIEGIYKHQDSQRKSSPRK